MAKSLTKPVRIAVSRPRKPRKTVTFLHKPSCATCRKARRFMEKHGYKLNFRDITRNKLSVAELQKLIGTHDHEDFLNPRSDLYQEKNMKENPPTRREAIGMMARDPRLIRRPVIV